MGMMGTFPQRSFSCRSGVLALCLGMIFALPQCGKEEKGPQRAPDFSLTTLDGTKITLSEMRGKVILLDFWATWCEPCREAIPHLVELRHRHSEDGFEIIALSMDQGDLEPVRKFVRARDLPYPVGIAPEGVARNYRVSALPTSVLIDKQGNIRERVVGFNVSIAHRISDRVAQLASEKN